MRHCPARSSSGPRYGTELLGELTNTGALATSRGTVHPLLTRLRREEPVTTDWSESPSGPPRRYYALTDKGRTALADLAVVWAEFTQAVDRLITPDQHADRREQ